MTHETKESRRHLLSLTDPGGRAVRQRGAARPGRSKLRTSRNETGREPVFPLGMCYRLLFWFLCVCEHWLESVLGGGAKCCEGAGCSRRGGGCWVVVEHWAWRPDGPGWGEEGVDLWGEGCVGVL